MWAGNATGPGAAAVFAVFAETAITTKMYGTSGIVFVKTALKEYPKEMCRQIAVQIRKRIQIIVWQQAQRSQEADTRLENRFYMPLDPYLEQHATGQIGFDYCVYNDKAATREHYEYVDRRDKERERERWIKMQSLTQEQLARLHHNRKQALHRRASMQAKERQAKQDELDRLAQQRHETVVADK